MPPPDSFVLGSLSVERFLQKYWQKEPLVVRQAFPGLSDPLTPDELAGLACEPHVDSRLVMQRGGARPWQVTRGPQRAKDLRALPPSHWTLLVESVDRHCDDIAAFSTGFSFLPRWRMDDVMVSLAPVHGTVDAHIDSYDVFLIQGQGRRRWEVDRRALPDYRPGLDLRILSRFRVEDSWVLDPGDMLYVPPGVGHRGVTVPSDAAVALTYSVGFRAPSTGDLLSSLLTHALASEAPRLFSDRGRGPAPDPGELSSSDLVALRRFLLKSIDAPESLAWTLAAGEAVTTGGALRPPAGRITARNVAARLEAGALLAPVPGARILWTRHDPGRAILFVNGESRVLPRAQAFAASFLCGQRSPAVARRIASNAALLALVVDLLRAGVLAFSPMDATSTRPGRRLRP
jgi:50S ribosomal protein L16 3-hydroxylase